MPDSGELLGSLKNLILGKCSEECLAHKKLYVSIFISSGIGIIIMH